MDESKIIETYKEGIHAVITVVKDMSSRVDLLGGTITGLHSEIGGLNAKIGHLNNAMHDLKESSANQALMIAELEARLNKNSNNSSQPPSQDGYRKELKNSRQKSGKATGGQSGHEGKTLERVTNPDKIVELKIQMLCDCGCNLQSIASHPQFP